MPGKPVSQFIVVPPADQKAAVMAAKEQFKAHLSENFPGYDFMVTGQAPIHDEEFQVIPVMGTVGDGVRQDGAFAMREQPERWFLDDIVQVCRRFNVASSRRRAS